MSELPYATDEGCRKVKEIYWDRQKAIVTDREVERHNGRSAAVEELFLSVYKGGKGSVSHSTDRS